MTCCNLSIPWGASKRPIPYTISMEILLIWTNIYREGLVIERKVMDVDVPQMSACLLQQFEVKEKENWFYDIRLLS